MPPPPLSNRASAAAGTSSSGTVLWLLLFVACGVAAATFYLKRGRSHSGGQYLRITVSAPEDGDEDGADRRWFPTLPSGRLPSLQLPKLPPLFSPRPLPRKRPPPPPPRGQIQPRDLASSSIDSTPRPLVDDSLSSTLSHAGEHDTPINASDGAQCDSATPAVPAPANCNSRKKLPPPIPTNRRNRVAQPPEESI